MADSQQTENPYQSPQSELSEVSSQEAAASPLHPGPFWLLFSFEGRIPRLKFWATMILLFPALHAATFFLNPAVAFPLRLLPSRELVDKLSFCAVLVVAFFLAWINFAVLAKRWHDRDKSGWWSLVGLIPYVGPLWIWIELGFFPGTGTNRYGPDPQRSRPTNPS